jgi:hypothetical protein
MTNQRRRDKESIAGSHRNARELSGSKVRAGYGEVSTVLAWEAKRFGISDLAGCARGYPGRDLKNEIEV